VKLKLNSSEADAGDKKEENECDNSYVKNNCYDNCFFFHGVEECEEGSYTT
jgi:hypothetical protein